MGWPAEVPDLTARTGDRFNRPIQFRDSSGAQLDITSYGTTWDAQLRRDPEDEDDVAFTVTTDLVHGLITLALLGEQTADLVGTYGWDLRADLHGEPFTYVAGRLVFQKDITQ